MSCGHVLCRELFHALSPLLHMLCELATSQLEALHHGVKAAHAPIPHLELPDQQHTQASDRQPSAHQSLSQPYPHSSVNLDQLSIRLSCVQAAVQVTQLARTHNHAVHKLQELMTQITKDHATIFNEAVDLACRCYAATPYPAVLKSPPPLPPHLCLRPQTQPISGEVNGASCGSTCCLL